MNKSLLIAATIFVVIAFSVVVISRVVSPSDAGKNLSTFFCGRGTQFILTDSEIIYQDKSCPVQLKRIESESRLFFLENDGPLSSYPNLYPEYEVQLSSECSFSKNFLPQQYLVADEMFLLYICYNP